MALQVGPYYVLPDVGSHGRIKTYIQVLGQWLLKKLEAAFLKQHAGKVKILGMLFFYARFCLLLPVWLLGKDTSSALFSR